RRRRVSDLFFFILHPSSFILPRTTMNLLCPNCGKMLTVPEQYAGQMMKCPLCMGTFTVPALPSGAGVEPAGAQQPAPPPTPPPRLRPGGRGGAGGPARPAAAPAGPPPRPGPGGPGLPAGPAAPRPPARRHGAATTDQPEGDAWPRCDRPATAEPGLSQRLQ